MKIYGSFSELVGHTPLCSLKRIAEKYSLECEIVAKLESFNPAGSAKDRVALEMISTLEREGRLTPDTVIVEPTSGNTGIGLAAVCASRGYRAIIVMPDNMSAERRTLIASYGAQIVLTDGALGMKGAIARAEEIVKAESGAIMAGQFTNPANPRAHYAATGPEIYGDCDGKIDVLVATVGTGGTLSGTGKYLKEKNENIRIIAVEPEASPYLSKGISGAHGIQGIGAGFIPDTLDTEIYDEIITVSDDDAIRFSRELAKTEGYLTGISSGAALSAAVEVAKRAEMRSKRIVVVLPDTGERYLSNFTES